MLNKKAVIVISSLGLIALSQLLIAFAAHRARHKTLQINTLSSQTSSKEKNIFTTSIKKQEEESRPQSESFRRGSDTAETTMAAAAAAATTISTNITNADNEITVPTLTLAGIVPSPVVPFSTTESAIKGSPSRTPKEQEISISDEARKAGESLKELIVAAIKDAKDSAKGTGKRLKEETIGIAATTDSKDIKSSGDDVNTLVGLFEKTMVEIRKEHYNEQIKLLQSYKDLIQTQIKVVSARGKMASKLKPGA
jgi:DNA-binding XRE family transcriptional regulator